MSAVDGDCPAQRGGQGVRVAESTEAAALFEEFYARLAGWCRSLVGSEALAHDIASEAFTRLWSRWGRVDEPRAYLYTIASNLIKDHWRRTERERRTLQRIGSTAEEAQSPADSATDIRDLVQSLPKRLRTPVLLHYYADLPVLRIAEVLGRSSGSVKTDLHRARQLLRAELRDIHDIS
ncbi:RNA polymerase sigma factor [Streptomyces albus]|nr:RNA polymerase sigma factor [Streptomyces albus]